MSWISADEFLDAEELSETRHWYSAGVVTLIEGESVEHSVTTVNLSVALHTALRGRGFGVVSTIVMFWAGSKETYVYPDVMVIRRPVATKEGRPKIVTNPVFVAEVLSPGTEGDDRGRKSREYRASPSIRQYALLSQDRPLVEIHTRGEDGYWRISEVSGMDADCAFSSLGCSVPMAALYEGVLES